MQLPYSEELNIENFSRLFDNTSECYKFFWFKAIVGKAVEGKQEIWTMDIQNMSWVEDTKNEVDFLIDQLKLQGNEKILDLACVWIWKTFSGISQTWI